MKGRCAKMRWAKIILSMFIIIILIFSSIIYIRTKHNGYYRRHKSIIKYFLKDKSVFNNIKQYQKERQARKETDEYYFNKTLKRNGKKPLVLPTYEKTGQAVHPDILFRSNGLKGNKYWLAYTPYPYSNDKFENPHVAVSDDGKKFFLKKGMRNPVVEPPSDVTEGGHFSDTDLMYEDNNFILHYVYNKRGVLGPSKFFRVKSLDGIKWTKPELVFTSSLTNQGYSPAFIKEKDEVKMWYLAGENNLVLFESKDDEKSWGNMKKCNIKIQGWVPWHIDVIKTDKGYEGVVCARKIKTTNNRLLRALFYTYSSDGINWTVTKYPIIYPNRESWDNDQIYRATILKDGGKYKIWYSALDENGIWNTGNCEFTKDEIENAEFGERTA